ncbi:Na+/proline symporter [Aquimarina sp. MAR_2010_214]|uniref:sensor histidine kinase n=1 Tax=Aquimarina sp. MAR_2010_214 TaxID=1250026 RepID=UPI000C70855F|nr:sensor histidine kinase [Aquimarina sp. MAR_2010_214]PKV51745.1 Na+/proline symporter [Aquimarina sp. MAR_2010_214]
MNNYLLISIIIAYLACLFLIAFWAEKNSKSKWVNNPYIYVLSLAVYCSAWTYYGSVGMASQSGISFLAIYLGPVISLPLWILVMRKIIRISKQHKISSIADFISLRYGNNRLLGALVTIICVFAIVPYISLQLKAISETFEIITDETSYVSKSVLDDSTFYIAVLLAVFVAFFGTQATDASQRRKGIMTTVAVESILKLVFFLIAGVYVTFFLFDGTTDIYQQASQLDNFKEITSFNGVEAGFNWLFTITLSFFAIFLLPRQFHVAVVENDRERYLKKAIWLFPLYLLLFNIFVIFIAWGGNLTLTSEMNNDYYTLLLPLHNDNVVLAMLVFLGGFSAVISMVVVSTLALSTMVSNNLIIPYGFLDKFIKGNPEKNANYIKNIRRISIFILIIIAYFFYINFSYELSLFSIGLISFVVIAQLAPSFFIGLFWNRGSAKAAKMSMIIGISVVVYTLILPFIVNVLTGSPSFVNDGLFGIKLLKPYELFGIDFLSPEAHAFFWSMFLNTFSFLILSLLSKGNYRERNYAEMFINSKNYANLQDGAFIWKGEAYVSDIRNVLNRFLGEQRTERALNLFNLKYGVSKEEEMADARLINFSEKLLTGSIGSASAKILISNVAKEQPVSLLEVLKILEESKETISSNKALQEKSKELTALTNQLKEANSELLIQDRLKDEFLDTVAHELKTPITSIKAASEVLTESDDMPEEIRDKFLDNIVNDADRLARLIHNILDLEKLSSGREQLEIQSKQMEDTIKKAIYGITQMAQNKRVEVVYQNNSEVSARYDEDRMLQVLTNLLSNALKFTESEKGIITVTTEEKKNEIVVAIEDNGKGVPKEDFNHIFDKFYQSKHQNIKKPVGSGLGLAISKKIIESHHGKIWVDKKYKKGARFVFAIPK